MEVVHWLILNCAQPACFLSVILSCVNQEKVVLLLISLIKINKKIKKINKRKNARNGRLSPGLVLIGSMLFCT